MSIANTPANYAPAEPAIFPADEVVAEPTKRWTVAEYHELIRQGFLNEDDPYELIEGWIVRKLPKSIAHNAASRRLLHLLMSKLDEQKWIVGCQCSLTIPESESEPEPDFAVSHGPIQRYQHRNPRGTDTALVIEVADASLARDRGMKLRSYARAGIPQYWIVNLRDRQIEVYSRPVTTGGTSRYEQVTAHSADESVLLILEGATLFELAINDVLPPPSAP